VSMSEVVCTNVRSHLHTPIWSGSHSGWSVPYPLPVSWAAADASLTDA
jgi:hypothetical protein